MECQFKNLIQLAQVKVQWQAFVNVVMSSRVA